MNTNFKRILTLCLALLMTVGVVFGAVACAETSDSSDASGESATGNADESAGNQNESTAVTEDDERHAYDQIEKQDFGGKTFVVCNRDETKEDMDVEKLSGDILDDAIYERNKTVSENFNIKFVFDTKEDYNEVNTTLSTQATTGTDEYDIYIGHKFSFNACAQQNYCLNLNNISTLNLDEEWWDQDCYENLTVDGKTFCMTGDISPTSMRASSCYVYNKDLMADLQKDGKALVNLAKNGKWTLDMLAEYTANVTASIDGKEGISYEGDRYGLVSWMMDIPFSLYYGAGSPFISIDENGTPVMTHSEQGTETFLDIYETIYRIIVDQQAYFITNPDDYETCYEVFADGRALFCDLTLSKINGMIVQKNMQDDYGILPVPKYDESQTEYPSFVNGAIPFIMVARTEADEEFVGTILEAMATYNYDNVTPNMFEIVTKLQAATDPDSSAMVDVIIRNRIFDLAYFHDWDISNLVLNGLKENTPSLSSKITGALKKAELRTLSELVKAYEECD